MARKKLCIDIGNTRVKAALFEDEHELQYNGDLNITDLQTLLNLSDQVIVSETGSSPEMNAIISEWGTAHFVKAHSELPVILDYNSPDTLGSDRICAAVGSYHLYPKQDALILDAGTCITLDLLDAQGVFRGGMISPGIEMRFRAMHEFTAKLPMVKFDASVTFPGKSSTESMQIGVYQSIKNELMGYFDLLNEQFKDLIIVDCSGMRIDFDKALNYRIFAQPKLVLYGLNVIADYNA